MDVVMGRFFEEKEIERTFLLSEYGKQKLLAYADSFKEIAGTLDGDFSWGGSGESRQSRLCNRKLWENRCMLADNLNEMAEVMAQIAGEVFSYRSFPDREYKRISRLMKSENIFITDMFYIENEVDRNLLMKALNKLSARERLIIQLRFGIDSIKGEEKTQKDVAEMMGISQSYISRLEKKIIKKLRYQLNDDNCRIS